MAATQTVRPWRTVVRTVFQMVVALATLVPLVVTGVYSDGAEVPAAVAQVVVVAGAVTRVMSLPVVEDFLSKFFPWLAADPE